MAYIVQGGRLVKVVKERKPKASEFQQVPRDPVIEIPFANAAPNPAHKGVFGKNCNRQACQKPGATWWNIGTHKYYCASCAHLINSGARHFESDVLCFEKKRSLKNEICDRL